MRNINEYLLMIIGNFLEIRDILKLSATCKKANHVFRDYFELYKRECKRRYINPCNCFKNQLMSNKSDSKDVNNANDPGFLCKDDTTKVWKDLILEGLSLEHSWSKGNYLTTHFDPEIIKYLGEALIGILRTPDLTVPALIKHDPNVDLHSVYSQYLYEYLFRMNDVYCGKRPAAAFTFLSEKEDFIQKSFLNLKELSRKDYYDSLAYEIKSLDETQIFFNLRWYCSSPKFSSFSTESSYASTQFTTQLSEVIGAKEVKSELASLLLLIHETMTFHCKLTYEVIAEVEDQFRFLQEYNKRWNAFVASMVKLDEMLIPLNITVSMVYRKIFPGFEFCPQFSFLRFFLSIWRREVYNNLKDTIEDYIVLILKKFHKDCLIYCQEEKTIRKEKKCNRTSLSDYFSKSQRGSETGEGFKSMLNPRLSEINVKAKDLKSSFCDAKMDNQDEELSYLLDIDMMYGKEYDSNIPSIGREGKECFKQTIIDVMDLSMNEFSMHYILHSENEYMAPFTDLKKRIEEELFKFYKTSCQKIPFKLWSEIIEEHSIILSDILPVSLLKELNKHKFSFVKKYTKNRIKVQLEKYSKATKKLKKAEENAKMIVMNAHSDNHEGTVLNREAYLESTVAEFLDTPFHQYLVSCLKSRSNKSTILSLLAHIKENEVDIMNVYNEHFRVNAKFESTLKSKNNRIQRYKEPRGFPLNLPASESALYSMDHDITLQLLEKFRTEKEFEMKQNLHNKEEDEHCLDNSFGADSCEDDMPFDFDLTRERCSNTEKRTFKFEPLSTLNLVKGSKEVDIDMDIEEAKTERENVREENKNNFGSISSLFKSSNAVDQTQHLSPFDSCESEGLRLQRTSNISCTATLPDNQMLRFSDLENMDDEFDMNDIPESLSFKRC